MPERSALFLDGAYLEYFLNKTYNQAPLDFAKLVRALTPPNSKLLRAYYYHSLPFVDDDAEEKIWQLYEGRKRFFHALNMKAGLKVREGRVTRRFDVNGEPIYSQQGTDILLVLDLANFAHKHLIDSAVLLTGDSSFTPAVQMAQQEGVRVVVWHAPNESTSNRLLIAADEAYPVDQAVVDLCAPDEEDRIGRRDPEPEIRESREARESRDTRDVRETARPAMPVPARPARSIPASAVRPVEAATAPAHQATHDGQRVENDPWDD